MQGTQVFQLGNFWRQCTDLGHIELEFLQGLQFANFGWKTVKPLFGSVFVAQLKRPQIAEQISGKDGDFPQLSALRNFWRQGFDAPAAHPQFFQVFKAGDFHRDDADGVIGYGAFAYPLVIPGGQFAQVVGDVA